MSGTVAQPEGITNPPIDDLLETVDSKYALVLYAAKRARQINAYYAQLQGDGLLEHVGPLVDVDDQEKALSIDARLLEAREITEEEAAATAEETGPAPLQLGDDAPAVDVPLTDFTF